jgi:S-adenosylmethionine-diacylglycerol 3-amino-3-carboxypropyl transferase
MSPEEHADCYARLVAAASPRARFVYWNMLVPRGIPGSLAARVRSLDDVATGLHARDRAWFYSALHVDEVGA